MNRETGKLASRCGQARFASRPLRAGMSRDQLILIIVVVAAVVVAAVTVTIVLTRPKGNPIYWECLKCGHIFDNREKSLAPIDCPKSGCDGQAVHLTYRNCRGCGAKVPMWHERKIEGQKTAQYYYKKDDGNWAWSPWLVLPTAADVERMQNSIWKCPKCE